MGISVTAPGRVAHAALGTATDYEEANGLCQLAINRLSDNVGGVKQISSVLVRALGRARHFALVEELPYQPGSLVIVFRSALSPTHASLRSQLRS